MKNKLLSLVVLGMLGMLQVNGQISAFPYSYDFENENTGPTGCNPTYTMVEAGWLNAAGDNMDWTNDVNTTGSGSTGPSLDHTPTGTFYMYLEASCSAARTAYLETPTFDFSSVTNPEVSFWYHMYGASMGTMSLEIDTTGTGNWIQVFTISGQQHISSTDPWTQATISLGAYAGAPSAKMRFVGTTLATNFYGDMAIDDFLVENIVNDDAGIISVDAPMVPLSAGVSAVDVTLNNFGANALVSADIEWEANGTPQTTFAWTGNLAAGQAVATPINIGSYNFPNGFTTIKAWTNLPNGVADQSVGNDTIEVTLCTAMKGAYTLGGVAADFNTFGDLATALTTCGVDSHVVVNVNPGTYNERLILTTIPGASSGATVTIDGADTSLVTISNNTYSNVYLNGADWVTITNMTLENTGTVDAYGVQLRDSAMYNTISNCAINLSMNTGLSDVIGVSASNIETSSTSEGMNAYWTTVDNNLISGGEKGIHFEGAFATRNVGNVFSNNTIDSPEDYGIYIDDQDSIKIIGNTITNIRTTFGDGIYTFDIMMFEIAYNNVVEAPDYGIYVSDGNFDAVPTSRSLVVNNMVSSTSDYAIYFDDVNETDVWHNTAYNTSGVGSAFRVNDIIGVDIRNNIFVSQTDYALESLDDITLNGNTVDYNDYWTPGTNANFVRDGGVAYANLGAWVAAKPTINARSIENDPLFLNSADLHAISLNVNDRGDNAIGVTDDIDGDSRPMGPQVDMGADEFTPLMFNAAFVSILEPASIICGDSLTPVTVIIRNLGDTITNMNIGVEVTGDLTANFTYNYTDTLLFSEYDTVTVGTINTYTGVNYNMLSYVDLVGEQDASNDTSSVYAFIARPHVPVGFNGVACDSDSALITALSLPGTNYGWYDAPSGGNLVGTGDSYMIPSVSTQNTYFLEYLPGNDSLIMGTTAGNGCGGGNMFDVTSLGGTSVTGFSVASDLAAGSAITVTVHYIANGSYIGNETNGAAWTTHGTYNLTSAGNAAGVFTKVDFSGNPIIIPSGATYGVYVEFAANYSNGNNIYSNSELSVSTGVGLCSAFGGVNNSRSFNGAIHYSSEDCSDIRIEISAVHDTTATASFTSTPTHNTVVFDGTNTTHQDSVTWDFGDGNTSTSLTPTHTYAVDSTYIVCLTAYSFCGIDVLCDTMDVCDSLGGNFTVNVNGFISSFTDMSAGNPVSWFWDFGDGNTSTQQNPTHTYSSDSTYLVTLVVTNYCGDMSVYTGFITAVGVAEYNNPDLVTVAPNPSNGAFVLNLVNYKADNLTLTVVDQLGKTIYSEALNKDQQSSKFEMDLRGNAKGVYFLRVTSEKGTLTKKLIIR